MDRQQWYIAGPISGKPDLNRAAFRDVQMLLTALGKRSTIPHDISPHFHEHACPANFKIPDNCQHAECCYLRGDIAYVLSHCSHVVVMEGWEASNGTRLEVAVFAQCGLNIHFMPKRSASLLEGAAKNGNVTDWAISNKPFALALVGLM